MVSALVRDLSDTNTPVVLTQHTTYHRIPTPDKACIISTDKEHFTATDLEQLWTTYFTPHDCCLLLAPESDNSLLRLTAHAESCAIPLLSSASTAVQATTSKRATTHTLQRHNIPAPPIIALDSIDDHDTNPYILKPDDGAGCVDTFCLKGKSALKHGQEQHPNAIITPCLDGDSLSLTLLCDGNGKAQVLSCNQHQCVCNDGTLRLRTIDVGIPRTHAQQTRYQEIATAIAGVFPNLYGFVGIDFIDNDNTLSIIDINPRVTTSYVGLRQALGDNPAAFLLSLHQTHRLQDNYPAAHTPTRVNL